MSTPDRPFLAWLRTHGGVPVRPGYGAQPHGSEAKRRAGYPLGQTKQVNDQACRMTTGRMPVKGAPPQDGSPRANDAALRPEKPAVPGLTCALFLPGAEKSSIKSTP